MTLEELTALLRALDPSVLLVSPRLLVRLLRQVRRLPARFIRVPHRKSFLIDRQILFQHAEPEELGLEPDRLLPPTVILLPRPTPEDLRQRGREGILLQYWRLLFHASVHRLLEAKMADGSLSAEAVGGRIAQVGRDEFHEIRRVLEQEHFLFPGVGDAEVYVEFAALYLELRFFRGNLRPVYFPAVRDFARIDQVLAQDLTAAAVFAATRPAGAPDPVQRPDRNADEPDEEYWRLVRRAERAARKGNLVYAAVFRTQAANRAPSALVQLTREEALADLRRLTLRLQAALDQSDIQAREWLQYLPALLEKTDQGPRTSEARLLYDLQKVCIDFEREIYALDLVEWALSGNRPIKRPLPGQRLVRITLHLRSATKRLTTARLADGDRAQLHRLLSTALHLSEARLQARFRPILTAALLDVGLKAHNAPEQTAFSKMVEELLDRITEVGFITFSDLRDVVSRNQLKLPDVDHPEQFMRGDPLLRLDRRLATALDGVYLRGEFYLRWLERLTSLGFGTRLGRALTLFGLLPFGGAMLLVEAGQLLVNHIVGPGAPVFGPLSLLGALAMPAGEAGRAEPVAGTLSFLGVALFLLGLMNLEPLRRVCKRLVKKSYRVGRTVLIDVPAKVIALPALRRVWQSWPFQLFYWYLFKPLLLGALAEWWTGSPLTGAAVFLAAIFLLNSRVGMAVRAGLAGAMFRLFDWIKAGLIKNLFHLIVRFFKGITDGVEVVLFSVENWLRFRGGDSRLSMVFRAILGVIWFPVAYLARLYMVVLIEPGFNPLKAPISIAAAKLVYPLTFALGLKELMAAPLEPLLGAYCAGVIAWMTWWLLPDAFGFLIWEMKENWSLYRANRPARLKPVYLGPHGETMVQLLQPGFHSGTLPKLYSRLRAAERAAYESGSWRVARAYREALQDVEQAVRHFLERELLTLLDQDGPGKELPLKVGAIWLASNRVSFELGHRDFPQTPVRIGLAEQYGWLMASVLEPGWLDRLGGAPFRALVRAFGGLFKLAGVHLVREQIQAALPAGAAFEVTSAGLAVGLNGDGRVQAIYDLGREGKRLRPRYPGGKVCDALPLLDARRVIFARVPLTWEQWVASWKEDRANPADLPLLVAFAPLAGPQESTRSYPPEAKSPSGLKAEILPVDGPRLAPALAGEAVPAGSGPGNGEAPKSPAAPVGLGLLAVPAAAPATALEVTPSTHAGRAERGSSSLEEPEVLFSSLPRPFGRYQVLQRLGEGGMGAVYLARDTTLDRDVALKVARGRARESAEATARFLREARAAAALRDEGICRVLDFGNIDGTNFISMEYIEGEPLSRLVAEGRPLGPRRAADLLAQVARALEEAHRHGVIHRDLKPANILIDERGRPRVVDFGLARREEDSTLTGQGVILGTPAYMSPEQVSGQPVGPATDVFSLGVILYQLLTGRLPFEGNLAQLTYLIVNKDPVPPSVHRPGLDPALEAVCRRAMAKDPAARYGSMAELAEALGRLAGQD